MIGRRWEVRLHGHGLAWPFLIGSFRRYQDAEQLAARMNEAAAVMGVDRPWHYKVNRRGMFVSWPARLSRL